MKNTIALLLLFLPTFTFAGAVQKTKHLELSAQGIDMLVINCGAGSLDLHSIEGPHKINVAAEIELEDVKKINLQKFTTWQRSHLCQHPGARRY